MAVAGLVPCAESGISSFLRGWPLRLEQRADHQDAGELAVRARGRLQRDRVHAGDFGEHLFERRHHFHDSLRERFGLIRMRPRQPVDARYLLVHARVVLHGAGAERIEAKIDGVVLSGEAREVADGFHLAHLGEIGDFRARILRAERRSGIDGGDIERRQLVAALAGRTALEQESFVLIYVRTDFLDHSKASATVSICSRRDISVAHSSMLFSSSG